MIKRTIFALLAAVVVGLVPAHVHAEELDGTLWKYQEKNWKFWGSDTLSFNNSAFRSENYASKGFPSAAYNASKDGDKITWTSTTMNPKGEKLEWNGVSSGTNMDGTVIHTGPDGKTETHAWKAELTLP